MVIWKQKKNFVKHFGYNWSLGTVLEIMFIFEANLYSKSFANIQWCGSYKTQDQKKKKKNSGSIECAVSMLTVAAMKGPGYDPHKYTTVCVVCDTLGVSLSLHQVPST